MINDKPAEAHQSIHEQYERRIKAASTLCRIYYELLAENTYLTEDDVRKLVAKKIESLK